jgi:acid phosphatase type 7
MSAPRHRRLLAAICLGVLGLVGSTASAEPQGVPILLAAGDVASCDSEGDERVAELVARTPGTIALLGDVVYDNGTADEFARCFMPAWAPMLPRIRAALGNHEYANGSSDAAAARAILRLSSDAWYSYDLGAWHVVVLNSNCAAVGGCHAGSRQWQWLRRDLRRHRTTLCTLAYWHQPRFSSGQHGSDVAFSAFWSLLAAARADVVLASHDHDYERFAPIAGIRSFVVGTGGRSLRGFGRVRAGSVARQSTSFGVLRLALLPRGYTWRFLTASGPPAADSGSGTCR